jgi:hypothetical protein
MDLLLKDMTETLSNWLQQQGALLPLNPLGFAFLALPTEFGVVEGLNAEIRSFEADWLPGVRQWPDDEWIIGEDGAGNYFVVSKAGLYGGIRRYDHEWKVFEEWQPTLRDYFEHAIQVEQRSR